MTLRNVHWDVWGENDRVEDRNMGDLYILHYIYIYFSDNDWMKASRALNALPAQMLRG